MVNYGKTYGGTAAAPTGTFYNEAVMLNLGELKTYATLLDVSGYMVNYATVYNYGLIIGGGNLGICLDEPDSLGGC